MNDCTIIIFGASGDLAKRKLFPALYELIAQGKLEKCVIVGAARDTVAAHDILMQARAYCSGVKEEFFVKLERAFIYHTLDFTQYDDFVALNELVHSQEHIHGLSGNRLLYCAAASEFYVPITSYSAQAGLAKVCTADDPVWHRIIYEKPFGQDLVTAQKINTCIARFFNETQIFRIDHYLTKEMVANISLLRFTNLFFESLWDYRSIESVQVIVHEQEGIGNRGFYYDAYGALKDVVQNHMLELVALLGMEPPTLLTGEYVPSERAKVLEKVQVRDAVLGQYNGYTHEPHVKADSTTETFALVALAIDTPRWQGVPFYLKTGKKLAKKETVIHIRFRQAPSLLTEGSTEANALTITIFPETSIALSLNLKNPELINGVTSTTMELFPSTVVKTVTAQAHEVIFESVMRGNQAIAVRMDEIESSWKIIDALKKMEPVLYPYAQGSSGPQEVKNFSIKHDIRWIV